MGASSRGKKKAVVRSPVIAKLRAPNVAAAVPRTGLFKRVDAELRRGRIVWVTASAGAGKTTLAASYLSARRLKPMWYQLDARDADPATLFHYLREAAARIAPRARRTLAALTPEYVLGLDAFARNFFEQMGGMLGAPCALVFDNYHELPDDSPVHALLAQGLRVLPEELGVLVLSRAEPPPAFGTLRAARRLKLLETDVLALTLVETRTLARRYRFKRLTPDAVANLYAQTRGWAAGVVLMLEEAARAQAASPQFDEPMPQAMFDYFVAEVLQRIPQAQQQVLLETALLSQVSADAARTLTGVQQAGNILAEFARRGYFVYAIAGREPVYQYHPLLREFLRARLERDTPPAALAGLHQRAAAVIAAAGNAEDAVQLWVEAQAWEDLVQYLHRAAPGLVEAGRGATLAAWIGLVPETRREPDPWLRFWLGQCRLPFDPAEARHHFEDALTRFEACGERSGALLAWCGIVDTVLHEGRDFGVLDRWIEAFARVAGSGSLSRDIEDHVVVRMLAALTMRQPQHRDLGRWCERAFAVLQRGTDVALRLMAGVHLCIHFNWVGDVARSRRSLALLSSLTRPPGVPPLLLILVRATESLHAWLTEADTSLSLSIYESACAYSRQVGVHVWDFHLASHAAAAALTAGDAALAHALLQQLGERLGEARLLDVGYFHYLANWDALQRADLAEAESHLLAAEALHRPLGLAYGDLLMSLMKTRTRLAQGRLDSARQALDEVHRLAEAVGSHQIEYAAAFEEAELALCENNEAQLRHWLAHALALGRTHGFVSFHGWRRARMSMLCARALDAGIEVPYVQALIRRRALKPPASDPGRLEHWPWPLKLYTLGRFALVRDGRPLASASGKGHKKPTELLQTLVALGGRQVAVEHLVALLWPDAEGDAAVNLFKITLHRLRRLLGLDSAIEYTEGRLTLSPRDVWVDTWAFARALAAGDSVDAGNRSEVVERALTLYRGHFLEREPAGNPALLRHREQLRARVLRTLKNHIGTLDRAGDWVTMTRLAGRALELDDIDEDLHAALLRGHLCQGQPAQAVRAFERARRIYASLQLKPSVRLQALHTQALAATRG